MKVWPWVSVFGLWTLATTCGVSLGLLLPTADPLLPFAPIAIATLTGLFQAWVLGYLQLIRRPWLWVVVTGAGGCLNFLMALIVVGQVSLGAAISGAGLGLLQALLLRASPRRRLRWTSTTVLWVITTALSYGAAAYWVIDQQGLGESPVAWVGVQAGLGAGVVKGAVLAALTGRD